MGKIYDDDVFLGGKVSVDEEIKARGEALAQQQQEEAVNANRPVSISELQSTVGRMEKQSPNGGAQRVSL